MDTFLRSTQCGTSWLVRGLCEGESDTAEFFGAPLIVLGGFWNLVPGMISQWYSCNDWCNLTMSPPSHLATQDCRIHAVMLLLECQWSSLDLR